MKYLKAESKILELCLLWMGYLKNIKMAPNLKLLKVIDIKLKIFFNKIFSEPAFTSLMDS